MIKNVYDTGAPNSAYLHYHHEMAYVNESVSKISFVCKVCAVRTGRLFSLWLDLFLCNRCLLECLSC